MRKTIAVAAALVLAFALAGCVTNVTEQKAPTMAASDTSASSSSSSSSSSEASAKWTDVKTADEAAESAGLDSFGVMGKIEAGDLEFANPSFAYAEGVAQATYEQPASMIVARKAKGSHEAPLSDRDEAEFASTWTQSYGGIDVDLYGAARGAATVFEWSDGGADYCVTFQGLGGDEMSMDSDEVAAVVEGMHEANATEPAVSSSSSAAGSSSGGVDNPLTEADIENLVFQNGLGALDSAQIFQGGDGHWYWSVVTRDTQNSPHTWTVDANGNFASADDTESNDGGVDNNLTEADVQQIVFDQGLGAYKYASLIEGADGVWYWRVCVGDVADNDRFLLVDPYGNVTEQQ